jgi:hypothetical protein
VAEAKLTNEEWLRVRAEWEVGATSDRKLAARYDISARAISKRRDAEGWQRAPGALTEAQQVGTMRGVLEHSKAPEEPREEGIILPPGPQPGPRPGPQYGPQSALGPQGGSRATAEEMAHLRAASIDRIAEAITVGVVGDLTNVEKLQQLHDIMVEQLLIYLTGTDTDAVVDAAKRLFGVGRDGVPAVLAAIGQMAERIQKIRRVAVGMEERPKTLVHTGPGGGPIQTEVTPKIDLTHLPTAVLENLYMAGLHLRGEQGRPEPLQPPGDPHQHSGDDAAQHHHPSGDDVGGTT